MPDEVNDQVKAEVKDGSTEINLDDLTPALSLDKAVNWKQRGPYLVAFQDGVEVATHVGLKYRLTGVKDNKPILELRKGS